MSNYIWYSKEGTRWETKVQCTNTSVGNPTSHPSRAAVQTSYYPLCGRNIPV